MLAIYSLGEQKPETTTKSRRKRKKRNGLFNWLWRERERPFPPLRGFESQYSSIINAECFVINKLPSFIVRGLPCWINSSIYLSPISIFFPIHNQIFSWFTLLRQLFGVYDDHQPRYRVGRQLLYFKLAIAPLNCI